MASKCVSIKVCVTSVAVSESSRCNKELSQVVALRRVMNGHRQVAVVHDFEWLNKHDQM